MRAIELSGEWPVGVEAFDPVVGCFADERPGILMPDTNGLDCYGY